MLAEHNLSMEDVAAGGEESESWIESEVHETGRWSLEDNLCYSIIEKYYFAKGFLNRRDNRKVFMLFGKPENVEAGKFVWAALRAAFDRHWAMYRILNKRPASERRLFVTGMANGFAMKLKEERDAQIMERDLVKGTTGTALAIAGIAEKTEAAYREKHKPGKRKSGGGFAETRGDRSTLQAGVEAGRSLNLNRSVEAAKRKAIES